MSSMLKLLITGGLGFIGSNFIVHLLNQTNEFKITNVDAELYGFNFRNVEEIKNNKNYQFVKGNICNKKLMEKLIDRSDIVVNFAAESFVDRSISNAAPFFNSNVQGIFTLLEIIKNKKKKLIQISTDEVFGSLKTGSANEFSRFNPSSPYAASKAAAELLVNSYHTTYDCECVITRCTNNYGPKQFPEKLIPKTILLAEKNMKIPIYGRGNNIRDWLFVIDHCNAIIKAMLKGKSGESYNISANNEIDNLVIVKKILEIMGKKTDLITHVEDRPGHDFRYSMISSKLRHNLGWKPMVKFQNGIELTVNWYLSHKTHWKNHLKITNNATPWQSKRYSG